MKDQGKEEKFLLPRIPVATYRMQFNAQFRFSDAREIIPYLRDLGISDIYASPYFRAREGSIHGYDIVDYNALNPEIGTQKDYDSMTDELRNCGMGQMLDIVPNHMCVASSDNEWWMDVLENGPSSRYADFFDIDWNPVKRELKDKVLFPVLGDQYGSVLESGELMLTCEDGEFYVRYFDYKFPIRPKTYTAVLKHRLADLKEKLSQDDPHLGEYLSIITALDHLPSHTERDPKKIEERYREKEVIKRRLRDLLNASGEITRFIFENVALFRGAKGQPESFDLLDGLLRKQAYRLCFWRVAADEINYRRFFDVNELAAVRMEVPAMYREAHALLFSLIRQERVTGLRVDHPDGLYNPTQYFRRLQRDCFVLTRLGRLDTLSGQIPCNHYEEVGDDTLLGAGGEEREAGLRMRYDEMISADPQVKPFYIVGEKILIKGERMPEDWPIFSTTGYVFMNSVGGIFIRMEHAAAFDKLYAVFTRSRAQYQEIVYEKKRLIMQVAMSSEIGALGHRLNRISETDRHTRDFTLNSLVAAIVEVIAFFPVYRTYITAAGVDDRDRRYIDIAVAKAKRKNPAVSASIFDFVRDVLQLNYPEQLDDEKKGEWLDFVMRFQQISGPVMAKGVEDTAFYVYNRLVSLNEVGGSPERFGTPLETFHGQNMERIKFWPHAMIATSTHDSKRSEDVRSRISVLSEMPDEWRERVMKWSRMNRKHKTVIEGEAVPDRNEEYLFYQTLVGVWPLGDMDGTAFGTFLERIRSYMLKAAREAKINTSWVNPNLPHEEAILAFVHRTIAGGKSNVFLKDFLGFQRKISHFGIFNSLSQTLLKITSPGVPDFYQGTELWNFSLVDPDNRGPVDYSRMTGMLAELLRRRSEISSAELAKELTLRKEDGTVKLYLTCRALNYRKTNRQLFEAGEYIPLEVMGPGAEHACAFARRHGKACAVIVAPRFLPDIVPQPDGLPFGEEVWKDSCVVVPVAAAGAKFRNIFTEEEAVTVEHNGADALLMSDVIRNFPVALMEFMS